MMSIKFKIYSVLIDADIALADHIWYDLRLKHCEDSVIYTISYLIRHDPNLKTYDEKSQSKTNL